MVLEVQNGDFGLFLHALEAALRKCSDSCKTVAGAAKIKVFYTSSPLRVSRKTRQNEFQSRSNRASHEDRAKNLSESSQDSVLNGSGALLSSWPLLGLSRARLGPFWASLWCFMGALWRPGPLRTLIFGGLVLCRAASWRPWEACFACFLCSRMSTASCAWRFGT